MCVTMLPRAHVMSYRQSNAQIKEWPRRRWRRQVRAVSRRQSDDLRLEWLSQRASEGEGAFAGRSALARRSRWTVHVLCQATCGLLVCPLECRLRRSRGRSHLQNRRPRNCQTLVRLSRMHSGAHTRFDAHDNSLGALEESLAHVLACECRSLQEEKFYSEGTRACVIHSSESYQVATELLWCADRCVKGMPRGAIRTHDVDLRIVQLPRR